MVFLFCFGLFNLFHIKMRYQFIGYPVPYKGKPIWEIVGSLKNFGVGRYIVEDEYKDKFVEPHFYKIVKVQPMDTPTEVGVNRKVLLWAEYVMRGKKLSELEQLLPKSQLNKFHLIPKEEEHKYLSGVVDKPRITRVPKLQTWPPLYKMIWEQKMKYKKGEFTPIPPLMTVIDQSEKSFLELTTEDIVEPPSDTNFHKTNVPVEELFKQIVSLRHELGIISEAEPSEDD